MAGRILLGSSALTFEGAGQDGEASRRIAYAEIASSRLGRAPADRVGGRPALVIDLSDGKRIRIATPEFGALHEVEEVLKERAAVGSLARG